MSTRGKIIILFPFSGYVHGDEREHLFWKNVEHAKLIDPLPVIILNRDTETQGKARAFLTDPRSKDLEILKVWSVDTCQMWLAGWGHVLDNHEDARRVVLLPGDIDEIRDEKQFFNSLDRFVGLDSSDIIIGDFETGDFFSSKELIDTYGTYQLLANWFPEISKRIHDEKSLRRPRSEFLNIDAHVLRKLLKERKFPYEQTINILIKSWDAIHKSWKFSIDIVKLGELKDDKSLRQFSGALDQIERTDRLLRLLWREENNPGPDATDDQISKFISNYDRKGRSSSRIMDSARITIRTLLGG